MSKINTYKQLEQGRASFAFDRATAGFNQHGKEYAQQAKRIPMLIKTNGLGATLAFMYSKTNQRVLLTLLQDIESWVSDDKNKKTARIYRDTEGKSLLQKMSNMPSVHYKAVTLETQAFLSWLRRFAEGIAKEKEVNKK